VAKKPGIEGGKITVGGVNLQNRASNEGRPKKLMERDCKVLGEGAGGEKGGTRESTKMSQGGLKTKHYWNRMGS